MIETFKIVTGIYDRVVSPTVLGMGSSDYRKLGQDMIYVNTISLIEC